jgi:hypothetical protein
MLFHIIASSFLNPLTLFIVLGSRRSVRGELKRHNNYIMITEVGELERSNPELIRVWIDATREFGVY